MAAEQWFWPGSRRSEGTPASHRETAGTRDGFEELLIEEPPPASERGPARQRQTAVLRALVVDRDDDRRQKMRSMLERERFVVDGADTEGAALSALEAGRYDLLFVDVSAEPEPALSLIERAKAPRARVTTPVVVATGQRSEPEALFQTLRAGALDYLPHDHPPCPDAGCVDCVESAWCCLPDRLSAAAEVAGRMRSLDDEAAAIASEFASLHGELRTPSRPPPSELGGQPVRTPHAVGAGLTLPIGALAADSFAIAHDDFGRTTALLLDVGDRGTNAAMRLASARVAAVDAIERGLGLPQVAEAVAEACEEGEGPTARPGLTLVRLNAAAGLVEVLCAGMPAGVGATPGGAPRTFACTAPRLTLARAWRAPVTTEQVRPGEGFLLVSDGLTRGALDEESAALVARRIFFDRVGAHMAEATRPELRALATELLDGARRGSDDASIVVVAPLTAA
jgi:CheY-like chemotaxis protein